VHLLRYNYTHKDRLQKFPETNIHNGRYISIYILLHVLFIYTLFKRHPLSLSLSNLLYITFAYFDILVLLPANKYNVKICKKGVINYKAVI
jgi:hypothetical protein